MNEIDNATCSSSNFAENVTDFWRAKHHDLSVKTKCATGSELMRLQQEIQRCGDQAHLWHLVYTVPWEAFCQSGEEYCEVEADVAPDALEMLDAYPDSNPLPGTPKKVLSSFEELGDPPSFEEAMELAEEGFGEPTNGKKRAD